jgi:hypothetical protein
MRAKLSGADDRLDAWNGGLGKRAFNATAAVLALAGVALTPALAQQAGTVAPPPNGVPLTFGMNADQASAVLGVPLQYVRGRPGSELLLASPNVKGAALSSRSDGLYLQFRRGRLTGWKGDWGTIRP